MSSPAVDSPTADVTALLRARNPLLWIVTKEEARVERQLIEAAAAAGYLPRMWDVVQGITDAGGSVVPDLSDTDPAGMLRAIRARAQRGGERAVWIMRDLAPWLAPGLGIVQRRQLRNLARYLPTTPRDAAQAIIILSVSGDVPAELAGHVTVIDWPMPSRTDIASILDSALMALPEGMRDAASPNGTREAAIDAAVGLSADEAQNCYARSLVTLRRIEPAAVAREKKRVISRERILEWYDPIPAGLAAVGGLDNLKKWLSGRAAAYSKEARNYGLPAPRGAMLVGVPGCGKSLTAKAIATAWGVPLLRMDLGSLKSKYVGDSEANLRKAFRVIESVGRCVVWLDEIEKALAGATGSAADGGVSADALGAILSWMQERQGEAFVIATANDVSALPPELLRKGRFDEIWFIDLPTADERAAILAAAVRAHGRDPLSIDLADVAAATSGFTGSEIAELIPDALYAAFADGPREPDTDDVMNAARSVVPLSRTAAEKITGLRNWAAGRARHASRIAEPEQATPASPSLDL